MNSSSAARRLILLALLLPGLAPILPAQTAAAWPVQAEGLHPDPDWRWGRLANGLRYAVRRNALPAGHVSYRFAVEVGAAHEGPEERGFAHFVEHMAFNGTRNHPGETLDRDMEKHGIALGPEVSAFTFLSHTIYQVDAPSNRPEDIDWTLMVLRDFADGQLFERGQVKRERGVIAAEQRDRDSVNQRYDTARRRAVYARSALSNPLTGDTEHTNAGPLQEFYRKWYRADRMLLFVVGDAEPEALEAAIHRRFDSLAKPASPPPPFDPGCLENPLESTTTVVHDPNSGGLLLEMVSILPNTRPDGLAERRRSLAGSIAASILSQRLAELTRLNPAVHNGGWARITATTPFALETSVSLQGKSGEWLRNTQALENELRRSFEYTFYPAEIAEACRRIIAAGEQHVRATASAKSEELAGWGMQEALWHMTSLSAADQLRLCREILPALDARNINEAWRSYWQAGRASILGYGYFPVRNASQLIGQTFAASSNLKLAPPRPPQGGAFAYTDFGPAVPPAKRTYAAAVDMHLLEFPNGIRVNLKHTDFDANTAFLSVRFGHGLQSEPPGSPALAPLATLSLLAGGLGRHSAEQLRHVLGDDPLSLQFSVNEAEFTFSGSAASQRLELLLQLLCAYLTDAAWDPKAFEAATVSLLAQHTDFERTSEGALGLAAFPAVTHDDLRYTSATEAGLRDVNIADVRTWLEPRLRTAPIEIGLVGDIPVEETVALLSRTVGALPARSPARAPEYPVRFSKQPGEHSVTVLHPCPRAALQLMWPADQGGDVHQSRRLEVLAALLNNRLFTRIREDLGAAYTPTGEYWKSQTDREEGYLIARVTTAPDKLDKVVALVREEADKLASRGASSEEFLEAITPFRKRCASDLHDNSYWLWRIAACAQDKPEVLDWPLTRTGDYEKMTAADVNALAREVLPGARAIVFTARPPSH